jgi:rsbT co-antagonist protein RsbR
MALESSSHDIGGAGMSWDLSRGTFNFLGLPSVTFWIDPSLRRLLEPLVDEVGAPLYRLLTAHHASLGTDADHATIMAAGDFVSGFRGWANAVAAAGWGRFTLLEYDPATPRARVRVDNPWELELQRSVPPERRWGCPFAQGKLIGLFCHALGDTCWGDEIVVADGHSVEFELYSSARTIESELDALRRERAAESQRQITTLLDERTRELGETRARLEQLVAAQEQEIRRMSTPILQVGEGTLAVPIIGVVDAGRAGEITELLLTSIVQRRARFVVLDVTGVDDVDPLTAERFAQIVGAVRLLGARCVMCGIQPRVAAQMVAAGITPGGAECFADMQAALRSLEKLEKAPRRAS